METTQKSTKTGKKQEKRDEKGRFIPGVSGNPGGKPQGIKHVSTVLREMLDQLVEGMDITHREALAKKIYRMSLIEGNTQMIKEIMDRTEGKVTEIIKSEISGTLTHEGMTDEKLDGFVDDFVTRFKKKLHERNKEIGE